MLDWKNRAGAAPERAAEPKSAARSYVGGLLFSRALATLLGIYLLVTIGLGWYWSHPLLHLKHDAAAHFSPESGGRDGHFILSERQAGEGVVSIAVARGGSNQVRGDRFRVHRRFCDYSAGPVGDGSENRGAGYLSLERLQQRCARERYE